MGMGKLRAGGRGGFGERLGETEAQRWEMGREVGFGVLLGKLRTEMEFRVRMGESEAQREDLG